MNISQRKAKQLEEAFSVVESNQALLAMCLTPLVSWLACTCLKQQMEAGRTLTEVADHDSSLSALPCPSYPQLSFWRLSWGLLLLLLRVSGRKILFSPGDLKKHGLGGVINATPLKMDVLQKHPTSLNYSFTHLCFQGVLCSSVLCFRGHGGQK